MKWFMPIYLHISGATVHVTPNKYICVYTSWWIKIKWNGRIFRI